MGHSITAIIGGPDVVAALGAAAGCPPATPLVQGWSIIPLGERQLDRLAGETLGAPTPGFIYLGANLDEMFRSFGARGDFVYLETNYFGGAGGQAAALYRGGHVFRREAQDVSRAPPSPNGPINQLLRDLGVVAAFGKDAFDTLGLGRFRAPEALGLEFEEE